MNKNVLYNLTLFITLVLAAGGIVMVYSASGMMSNDRYHNSMMFFIKQLIWISVGFLSFLFFRKFDYNKLKDNTTVILAATFLLLVLVLIFAPSINGARRWFRFGPFSFQPAELAKFTVVIFLAKYIHNWNKKMNDFKTGMFKPFLIMGPILLLVFLEKDFGIPTIIFVTIIILLFVGGAKLKHLFLIFLPIIPIAIVFILKYKYRLSRLTIFLNPWSDPDGAGYQIIQSLSAFGSGGLWGRGLGESKINNLFLPESHTDFIFPIIGEEIGFLGTILVVILFIILFYTGTQIAKYAKNTFGSILAFGITLTISLQAIVNMGVCLDLLPNKGLPLPFISFGGSSLLMTFTSIGILLNICRQIEK